MLILFARGSTKPFLPLFDAVPERRQIGTTQVLKRETVAITTGQRHKRDLHLVRRDIVGRNDARVGFQGLHQGNHSRRHGKQNPAVFCNDKGDVAGELQAVAEALFRENNQCSSV